MGLKVEGHGALPTQLIEALAPREGNVKSLLDLPMGEIEIPVLRGEQQKLAMELDRQIGILTKYADSDDPGVKADATHMLRIAREARLDLESRLLSWAISHVEDRGTQLNSQEADAIFALFGDTFSNGERDHAMKVLDAHLPSDIRKEKVDGRVDATIALADKVATRTSKKSRGVMVARAMPIFLGVGASRVISSLVAMEPSVALAVNLATIQAGMQAGHKMGTRASNNAAYLFGVNRFKQEVDHDLGFLFEKFTGLHMKMRSLDDEAGQKHVDELVAVGKMFIEARTSTWSERDDVSTGERKAVDKFSQIVAAFEKGGVQAARGRIENLGLTKKALLKLPSVPTLLRTPADPILTGDAFQTVLSEAAKSCLNVTNLPLKRMIRLLEDRHLTDGSPLTPGEAAALQQFAGEAPSVAEVFALGRLADAGVLKLPEVWPQGRVVGHDGQDLSPDDAKEIFETLGDRSRGNNLEAVGKWIGILAPFAAAAAAYAGAELVPGDPGIANLLQIMNYVGAIGASMAAHLGGMMFGRNIQRKGQMMKLEQGLNVPTSLGNEYALLMPQLSNPEALMKGSLSETKANLGQQAEMLNVVVDSVASAQANLRKAYDEIQNAGEASTPAEANARQVLSEILQAFEKSKSTHYVVLGAIRDEFTRLTGPDISEADVRAGLADTQRDLHSLLPITWYDIVQDQTQHEFSQPVLRYYDSKFQLIEALKGHDPANKVSDALDEAFQAFVEAREAVPKKERPPKDALDAVVKKLPKNKAKAAEIQRATSDSFIQSVARQRVSDLSIGNTRAGEIGQEILTAMWQQLFPAYGLVPDAQKAQGPISYQPKIVEIKSDDPTSFPTYRVETTVDHDGKLAFEVDAAGRFSPRIDELDLDLGTRRLGEMAETFIRGQLTTKNGKAPRQVQAKLVSHEDGMRTFEVHAEGGPHTVRIDSRGQLDTTTGSAQ